MRRLISTFVLALSALMFSHPGFGAESQNTAESQVSAFYTWFMKHDNDTTYPLREPAIEQYVAKDTIARLKDEYARSGPPGDVDYFLKVQDYDTQDWLTHIKTHHAIDLNGVTVVPVTFGSKDQVSVLVFMRKIGGQWRITKVDDTRDYK
ncbi:DUF3828 domain-containing protein [Paraburkholderia sacchari]|uniref:DUF3828 domain-containing protein n=1 Tax=Paraburkholderia sacchari TaxID=159450 RepID=UPI0039A570F5